MSQPTSPLSVGAPAPWFVARTSSNPNYNFDTVAGRYVALCFLGSSQRPASARVLADLKSHIGRFDGDHICFFGISGDPQDEGRAELVDNPPGFRFMWDDDGRIAASFGLGTGNRDRLDGVGTPGATYLLDERLRVLGVLPIQGDGSGHVEQLMKFIDLLPPLAPPVLAGVQAPVLVVPRVFEPALCRKLIELYETNGGQDSGFMRDVGGKTVGIVDYGHKRRRDYEIEDPEMRRACMTRIHDRLVPEIHKAFQFKVTRMERYLVACYDGSEGGHFRAHRDNTTKGTAHRRFAVSLHLNTGEYEGGLLRFPEFGRQVYAAPPGGAVVFSCSLLHKAMPVTKGRRFMFLPFLYDEEAARIRQENHHFLANAGKESAAS
jgi:peroxiredoxin